MSKLDKISITKMIKDKSSLPMYDLINNTIIMIPNDKIYYNFTKNYLSTWMIGGESSSMDFKEELTNLIDASYVSLGVYKN